MNNRDPATRRLPKPFRVGEITILRATGGRPASRPTIEGYRKGEDSSVDTKVGRAPEVYGTVNHSVASGGSESELTPRRAKA
jgi:hypothetical protein